MKHQRKEIQMKETIIKAVIFLGSVLPVIVFLVSFITLPILMGVASNPEELLEWNDLARITAFLIFTLTVLGYFFYIFKAEDSRLDGKKGLWVGMLLFANIFALPFFWYFYIYQKPAEIATM